MSFTTAGKNAAVDAFTGLGLYVGLLTNAIVPTAAGAGTEVASGKGYARAAIAFDAASGGIAGNSDEVSLGTATSAWGTIGYVAVYAASSGGTPLAYVAVEEATVGTGDDATLAAGTVTVTIP